MDGRSKLTLDFLPTFREPKRDSTGIREDLDREVATEHANESPSLHIALSQVSCEDSPEQLEQERRKDPPSPLGTDLEESDGEGQIEEKMKVLNSARTSSRGTARCPSYSPSNKFSTPTHISSVPRLIPSRSSFRTCRGKSPFHFDLTHRSKDLVLDTSGETSRTQVLKQMASGLYPRCRKKPVTPKSDLATGDEPKQPEGGLRDREEVESLRKIFEEVETKLRTQVAELSKSLMELRSDKAEMERTHSTLRQQLTADVEEAKAASESLLQAKNKLQGQYESAVRRASDAESQLNRAVAERDAVAQANADLRQQLYLKEQEHSGLKSQYEHSKQTVLSLQSGERKQQQELLCLREKLASLTSKLTVETRSAKLDQKTRESEQEDLRRDRDRLQGQLMNVNSENEALRAQVTILNKKLAYCQSDEQEAKENVDSYLVEIVRLKETIARLESKAYQESCGVVRKEPEAIQMISPLCSPGAFPPDSSPDCSPKPQFSVRRDVAKIAATVASQSRCKLTHLQQERSRLIDQLAQVQSTPVSRPKQTALEIEIALVESSIAAVKRKL